MGIRSNEWWEMRKARWSYIELSTNNTVNTSCLWNAGVLREWAEDSTWEQLQTRECMKWMSVMKIEQTRRTRLTNWMGFHAGIVSDRNRADEAHTTHVLDGISCRHCQRSKSSRRGADDSRTGWDFMQAISALKINSAISSLPPVGNIQTLPLCWFNHYLISLRSRLLANFPKLFLSHLHTKNMC